MMSLFNYDVIFCDSSKVNDNIFFINSSLTLAFLITNTKVEELNSSDIIIKINYVI